VLKARKMEQLQAANRIAIFTIAIRFLEVRTHVFEGASSQYDPTNRDTIARRAWKVIRV
jgi:hypothetical protein